jgi:undecaprenyl-diphosphatase
MTWGADEHILLGIAVGWWIWARSGSREQQRATDHVLLALVAASVAPHVLKGCFEGRFRSDQA